MNDPELFAAIRRYTREPVALEILAKFEAENEGKPQGIIEAMRQLLIEGTVRAFLDKDGELTVKKVDINN
jgi:hypothetical protein